MIPLSQLAPGVTPTGDFLVYLVKSRSRKGMAHRVDLSALSGFGECGCESFQCDLSKRIEQGEKLSPELECPHIRQARRYLAFEIAQSAITNRTNEANQNRKAQKHPPIQYSHGERAI